MTRPDPRNGAVAASKEVAAAILVKHAAAIRALGKKTVENIIEIGRRLTEAKRIVGHGNWLSWLEREFGWTDDTALNFMRAHELAKSRNFRDLSLPISSIYLLAAPSTPESAKTEVIERAQAGETLPVEEVKRVVDRHKPRRNKPTKLAKPTTTTPAPAPSPRDDIGPESASETEYLRARNEDLATSEQRAALLERQLADATSAATTLRGNDARAQINETLLKLSALIAGGGESMEQFICRLLIAGAKAVAEGDADFEQARRVLAKFGDGGHSKFGDVPMPLT